MLHVLLTILKITGIIIGILLGIIILLLAAVLFVPVRYKADGRGNDCGEVRGSFCVSWLLHLVRLKGTFNKDGPDYSLKVLCFTLKRKGKEKKKKDRKKKDREDSSKEELPVEEPSVEGKKTEGLDVSKAGSFGDYSEEKRKKKNIFFKIYDKIRGIISGIKDRLKAIFEKIEGIRNKIEEIKTFLSRKVVRDELKVIKEQTIKLIMHILPTRFRADVRLGMGEPDKTGMAVGFASAFCGLTGKNINIEADFEQKIIEADLDMKGRIRAYTVLIILLKIYRQKNVVAFVRNFKL